MITKSSCLVIQETSPPDTSQFVERQDAVVIDINACSRIVKAIVQLWTCRFSAVLSIDLLHVVIYLIKSHNRMIVASLFYIFEFRFLLTVT